MKTAFVCACMVIVFGISHGIRAEMVGDSDSDGLSDTDEINVYFTDPQDSDSDDDGFSDGDEVERGYSPRFGDRKKMIQVDSDKDHLNDAWEVKLGTGLMDPDSDGDTFLDGTEVAAGFDSLKGDRATLPKQILVDLKKQELTYAFGSVTLATFPISSGVKSMPTPKGSFRVLDKVPVKHYGGIGFDYPNTKWNLHFTSAKYKYYIHGAYWHHKFGTPMSHGCVNVSYENMEPLYWFSQKGTAITIKG